MAQSAASGGGPLRGQPDFQARLAAEMDALRRCREWLERLERGEQVMVNLRPESDPESNRVANPILRGLVAFPEGRV